MAGLGDAPFIQRLAVPAVCILIAFLGYSSQFLFLVGQDLKPGPLTRAETITFNVLLVCLWYTYYKACTVDPGRFTFTSDVLEVPSDNDDDAHLLSSSDEGEQDEDDNDSNSNDNEKQPTTTLKTPSAHRKPKRWCYKCAAPKPPRAHHCRTCARCIPKMDHHCPWTANCVSHTTFPHFLRFLIYANAALWYLCLLISYRFAALWTDRNLPAYLGPSMPVLVHLSFLAPVCFFTTFALGIMLVATGKDWVTNTTTIEGWEVDKHNEVVERSRSTGGGRWWSGDGEEDRRPRIVEKVEFPYDVGFFANMSQAMGTANPLAWVFPFSGGPAVAPTEGKGSGWEFEENGFNDTEGLWPPPNPDKRAPKHLMRGGRVRWPGARGSGDEDEHAVPAYSSREEEIEAFRERQEADIRRRQENRSRLMAELEEVEDYDIVDDAIPVDQQDDEVPLAELMRRRKVLRKDGQAD